MIIFTKGFPDTHDNTPVLPQVPVEAHRQLGSGKIVDARSYNTFYISSHNYRGSLET